MSSELEVFIVKQLKLGNKYLARLKDDDFLSRLKSGKIEYYWGRAEVLYDDPDKIRTDRDNKSLNLTPKLLTYFSAVKSELVVISPYFVPGKSGVQFFSQLVERGVRVKILTNSLMSNDVPIVHSGYVKYRKKLLEAGITLFEIDKALLETDWVRQKSEFPGDDIGSSKASLHAKYFILDRAQAFIGSLNVDPRSIVENTEIGVVIDAPELALQLAEDFDEFVKEIAFEVKLKDGKLAWYGRERDGTPKIFHNEPYSTWWDRFSVGVMKWLPVELQL
jgi:putative cardiolipin synthase